MAKKRGEPTEAERFAAMSRKERAEIIRPLMAAGSSYLSLARRFGVKKGMIAGICRDYKIASTHPSGFAHVRKGPSGVPLKLAPPGPLQCEATDENGHPCAVLKEPGSRYCIVHQRLEKRKREKE